MASIIKQRVYNNIQINGMGYNIADNLLYAAYLNPPSSLLRISGTGDAQLVGSLGNNWMVTCGEVDENSQYWASSSGVQWTQMDLKPDSPTYAKVVKSGTATLSGLTVYDWAYVPGRGNFLWGLGFNNGGDAPCNTYLLQFNRTSTTWTTVHNFGDVTGSSSKRNQWGAVYASDDGYLFGSENNSGHIYRFSFPVNGVVAQPEKISNGPPTSSNDGARCIKAANIGT